MQKIKAYTQKVNFTENILGVRRTNKLTCKDVILE